MRVLLLLLLGLLPALACAPGAPADCGLAPVHLNDPLGGELLQLRGPEACVRLERTDLSEPDFIYKARPWSLDRAVIAHPEGHEELSEDLEWVSTHHNWADEARAAGALYDYVVHLDYTKLDDGEFGWRFSLEGYDDAGALQLGPLELN